MNENKTSNLLDIDFKDLGLLLLKRLWVIILCFVLFFSYKWFFVEQKKVPTYTASGNMYVTNTDNKKYYYTTSDTYNALELIKTCGEIINTQTVRTEIASDLNKEHNTNVYTAGNLGAISVASINQTELMQVSVTTNNEQWSIDVCRGIIKNAQGILQDKIGVGTAVSLDKPTFAAKGNLPNLKSAITFGLIGAGGMAVLLVILYLLDNRIRSKEEITQQYGLAVLSDIPNFNVKSKERYNTYYEHR